MNNSKERERIIFMHDIPGGLDNAEDKAKQISIQYPELVIFSDPEPLSNGNNLDKLVSNSDNNLYNRDGSEYVMGSHIYKNGVKYSLVRGICPGRNSIAMDDKIIELQLDKFGFLRLVSYPINSGYFYVGPDNPFDKGYLIQQVWNDDNLLEYEVATTSRGGEEVPVIPFYNSIKEVLTTDINDAAGDFMGFTKLFPIDETYESFGYIFAPKKWFNSLLLSNDIGSLDIEITRDLSTIQDIITDQVNLDEQNIHLIEDIKIDGVEYALLKTAMKCEAIRIYSKG